MSESSFVKELYDLISKYKLGEPVGISTKDMFSSMMAYYESMIRLKVVFAETIEKESIKAGSPEHVDFLVKQAQKETDDMEEFRNTKLTAEEAKMLTQAKDFDSRMKKAVKESTTPKPPTVEISLEDAKKLYAMGKNLMENADNSYLEHNGLFCTEELKRTKQAISKAEGKDTASKKLVGTKEDWLEGEVEQLEMENESLIKQADYWCDKYKEQLERVENITLAQKLKEDPVNGPALPIQDQVNELRVELGKLKFCLNDLESTISKSNLSAHIRLGGGEPTNL